MGCTQPFKLATATLDSHPEFTLAGVCTLGKVVKIYDGDTVWCAVDRPLQATWRVRLLGIDTEEMRQPKSAENREAKLTAAFRARNRLAQLVTNAPVDLDCRLKGPEFDRLLASNSRLVHIEFTGTDKYGRALARIYELGSAVSVNQTLISDGHAVEYDGGTKKPVTVIV